MNPLVNRRFVIAVLTIACLLTLLIASTRRSFSGAGDYDPWLDINDDGKIDMKDVGAVARAVFTNGSSIAKASIEYDSGWIDITDKCGQNITITHNLDSTDLIVDIQGKTSLSSGPHQKHYGLAGYAAGWSKTYAGIASYDCAKDFVQTSDGGYALAGRTDSLGASSNPDFWLVKTDEAGNAQWNRTYGGTNYEEAYALVHTVDGGYALAGYTESFGAGGYDFWLVKADLAGNMQWNQTYGGTGWEGAYALVQTTDGGYALAGYSWSFGTGSSDAWLVKTDVSGNVQWNKTYGGTDWDGAYDLVQTSDGGYALAGDGGGDFWLVKTDVSGNVQWNKTYGGTSGGEAFALVQTTDGGYALAGRKWSSGAADFWLVKIDASGTMIWNRTYGGTDWDGAYDLVQTSDGGYALAGKTLSLDAFNFNAWLVKTDGVGNMQWNQTYGGGSMYCAYTLLQTTDGGYALAGEQSHPDENGDFCLVKIDVESGLAWVDSSANTVTLCRGATDTYWNYVRVRLWKPR